MFMYDHDKQDEMEPYLDYLDSINEPHLKKEKEERRKKYYVVPCDGWGQHGTDIYEEMLYQYEVELHRKRGNAVFRKYIQALYYTQD